MPARFAETEIQGIEIDAHKFSLLEFALGNHLLPIVRIGGMANTIVLITDVGEVGRARVAAESVARVGFVGEIARCFEFEDRRPLAVENRSALINLDAKRLLRSVPDKNIRPRRNRAMGEVDGEIGQLVNLASMRRGQQFVTAKLVAM